ncbi:Lrp/AsnC family transcriptional regulator [Gephyromycinifex aptenodytis]|uniref:Lrp/AsnC family transcriptional regulator n=1 Tax=Gephyromycinifex aptenodytis TaxID=2716227 RepID=UPI001447CD84|nr:Lrp/AsnC family transcriptional regulator [Gephyromycinifex aptenodytis]
MAPATGVDALDARIITLFTERPQIGVLGASRALGVARGTVQSRLERLVERGVIISFAPTISPAGTGYPVTAYCSLQISQVPGQSQVVEHLSAIPEVIEASTVTGAFDLLVIVVARNNDDLQRVIDHVVEHPLVERASTQIVLATRVRNRTLPLVQEAARTCVD